MSAFVVTMKNHISMNMAVDYLLHLVDNELDNLFDIGGIGELSGGFVEYGPILCVIE